MSSSSSSRHAGTAAGEDEVVRLRGSGSGGGGTGSSSSGSGGARQHPPQQQAPAAQQQQQQQSALPGSHNHQLQTPNVAAGAGTATGAPHVGDPLAALPITYHLYFESSFSPETFAIFNISEKTCLEGDALAEKIRAYVVSIQVRELLVHVRDRSVLTSASLCLVVRRSTTSSRRSCRRASSAC